MRRNRSGGPLLAAGLGGLCCALALLGGSAPQSAGETRPTSLLSADAEVASGITSALFGESTHHRMLAAMRQRNVARGVPETRRVQLVGFPYTSGMMLDDEGDEEDGDDEGDEEDGEDGDSQDDEYARFVWRKERLGKDWGVNVDSWLDPGLLDNIDYRDRPYTAGHHPSDENITNTTTMFFADDWPQVNETTNASWIDHEDFRWNSPYDYVGARPLVVDHHHMVDHHHVNFLPGVNINSDPFCGQNMDGSPIDCGDSEWNV